MISQLTIAHLRNLSSIELKPSPTFNVILGPNGSGKSSILEGLHLLSVGRSFRTHLIERIIQTNQDKLCVYVTLNDESSLGVEKSRDAPNRLRINGVSLTSQAEFAQRLPLQIIHPDGYELVSGPSKLRRQFIDWGTFHVEHSFLTWWRRAQRALIHRNKALRLQASIAEITAWNSELSALAELIDGARARYFSTLIPILNQILAQFLDVDLQISYLRGWDDELTLETVLQNTLERDRQMGFTQKGPQRADLKIRVGRVPVVDVLSRGQLKLLVSALRLAQGKHYQQHCHRPCIYLLDDLASELDQEKRRLLIAQLVELKSQVFMTGVDETQLGDVLAFTDVRLFHVEQLREK